jgi:porphobilinogen synthase
MAASDGFTPALKSRLHGAYSHPVMREWQSDTAKVEKQHMVYPIFVTDVPDMKEEIRAMPGQYRWGVERLDELIAPLVAQGLRAVLIFGVLSSTNHLKDKTGMRFIALRCWS